MRQEVSHFAVVPAAGIGARLGGDVPKQYLPIAGKPIIEHTLLRLLADARIQLIAVSIAEGDRHWPSLEISNHPSIRTTIGGATRAESVLNGLSALADVAQERDWVLVHDAARPCLSEVALARLIDELDDHHSGGLLAVPAQDTLKQATGSDKPVKVARTLDRSVIWHAQTPQMFRYGLIESALADALKSGAVITDEASAMERAGHDVMLVEGQQQNIKITTQNDLELAEPLLQMAGVKAVQ